MNAPWWDVLGIPRDSDRATKRRAYAARLKQTNPEDDPQGFMALREAYEAALNWVEYEEDWDDPSWEAEPVADAPADAPAPTVDDPVVDVSAPPVAIVPPDLPPREDTDPFADDRAELAAYVEQLEAGLRGPWAASDAELKVLLNRILSAPAMMELDTRDRVEFWLAELLADTVPRSDRLLLRAIETFRWSQEGERPPAVWRVLGRLDEWTLMHKLNRGEHELSDGWKALTRPDIAPWRRRLYALGPGLSGEVRQLFDLMQWQVPGIESHMDPGAARWWRAHLDAARFGFLDMTVIALAMVAALIVALVTSTPTARIGGVVGLLALGTAFPVLRLRYIAPWRAYRDATYRQPGWIDLGWVPIWAVAALLLIWLPIDAMGGGIVVALSALAALWMAVTVGRAPPMPLSAWPLISLGGLAALGGPAFIGLPGGQQAALAAFAVASLLIAHSGGQALSDLLWRVGEKPVLAAFALALLLVGAAITRAFLPMAPQPLVPWGAATIAGMALLHAVRDVHDGSPVVRFAPLLRWFLWLALVGAAILSLPAPASPPARDTVKALEQAEPALAALRFTTPDVYQAIMAIAARERKGELTAAQGQARIDAIVNREYHARLPRAPALLIAAEMDIRLAIKREQLASDRHARACVGAPDAAPFTPSEALRARQYRHALVVIGSGNASMPDKGRKLTADRLVQLAADGNPARAKRLASDLSARDPLTQCRAQIALLEALTAQSDADIAQTMRPALIERAARQSAKK